MIKKMLSFAFCAMISCTNAFSQLGYYYDDEFIELKPNKENGFFIQTRNKSTIRALNDLISNESKEGSKKTEVFFISEGNYLSSSLENINDDDYISYIYTNELGGQQIVLPRILVALKEGFSEDDIIKCVENGRKMLEIDAPSTKVGYYSISCAVKNSNEVLKYVSEIKNNQCVEWCEPDMLCDWRSFNNPLFDYQYYINNNIFPDNDINVLPVWSFLDGGSSDITVAIIDSGVDLSHEDLSGQLLQGYTVNDNTGYGRPVKPNENNDKSHGTSCAGIVSAKDNNIGIKGIAYDTKILPVNIVTNYAITENGGFATDSQMANAIRWAADRADILSCSWGSPNKVNVIRQAFDYARTHGRNGKGCVVVASSGNDYDIYPNSITYPAALDGVISVGAINELCNICSYSQRSSDLDLVAFGGELYGIVTLDITGNLGKNPNNTNNSPDLPNTNYTQNFRGTSAACPQVAAVAALMLSANPVLSESEVRTLLKETARDLGEAGADSIYGYGLVDATKAVLSSYYRRIEGPNLIYSSNSFAIDSLIEGETVEWNLSHNYYNENCLRQNYPVQNQCTIMRNSSYDMRNATLTATIKYNGKTIRTIKKTNINAYHGFKGQYNSLDISNEITSPVLYVAPDCCTYIYSPNLYGATISYSSSPAAPYLSNFLPEYATLVVGVSGNSNNIPVQVNIIDACGNNYTLTLIPYSSPYMINVTRADNGINFILEDTDSSIDFNSSITESWSCEIRNVTMGTLMAYKTTTNQSLFIPTDDWSHGTYIINIKIGKESLTYKIKIN